MAIINLWITHHGLVVHQYNEIYINKNKYKYCIAFSTNDIHNGRTIKQQYFTNKIK